MPTFREQALELARKEPDYGRDEPDRFAFRERVTEIVSDLYEKELRALFDLIPGRDKLSFYAQMQNYHLCERGCSYAGGLCSYHDTIQKVKRGIGIQD